MAEGKKRDINKVRVITPKFRVSYPSVFEKTAYEDGTPEYSVTALFPKSADLTPLRKAITAAIVDKWGSDKEKWPKKLRRPIRDGDEEKGDSPEFKNHWFIRFASKKNKPGVINAEKTERLTSEEDFYAGCYARAEICAYAYDKAGNKGISFDLWNLQKISDGERLSGRRDAFEVFDDLDDEELEEEMDDDEDEKPSKKKTAQSSKKRPVEDDDDEDEEEDDVKPVKNKSSKASLAHDDDEDEEEDDEPAPKKKSSPKASKPVKKTKSPRSDDDDFIFE